MDWPLTGSVAGAAIVAGLVTYGTVALIQSDSDQPRRAPTAAFLVPTAERPLADVTIAGGDAPRRPSGPFILTDSARTDEEAAAVIREPALAYLGKPPKLPDLKKAPVAASAEIKPPAAPQQIVVEHWRVTATSKANYFNLGGHIDRAGVVDSLASSHLREAFKSHRNFGRLPPDIQQHIATQNIDLCKIAPYRALLGIDDRKIEEEQAVRFERLVSNR